MNTQEGTELAYAGLKVFLVILVAGAMVALATFFNVKLQAGNDKLSQSVEELRNSEFSPYNNRTMAGDEVLLALEKFQTRDLILLVGNKNSNLAQRDFSSQHAWESTINDDPTFNCPYYNFGVYCAIKSPTSSLDSLGVFSFYKFSEVSKAYVTQDGGSEDPIANLSSITGSIDMDKRNDNIKAFSNESGYYYIDSGMQYYAELLYDPTTSDIVGIVFTPDYVSVHDQQSDI